MIIVIIIISIIIIVIMVIAIAIVMASSSLMFSLICIVMFIVMFESRRPEEDVTRFTGPADGSHCNCTPNSRSKILVFLDPTLGKS